MELEVFPLSSLLTEEERRRCQQFHLTRILSATSMKRLRSLLPHPNSLVQNSEEYSQEKKLALFRRRIKEMA